MADKIYDIDPLIAGHCHANQARYQALYQQSLEEPDTFWAEQAARFVTWFAPWQRVSDCDFAEGRIRWFEGGQLNVSFNCLDRHLEERGDQVALLFEGDDPDIDRKLTYRALHEAVCRFANALRSAGVGKGDRVCIYLPMIPEVAIAMLAVTRIGAVHSVVFGGFSAEALRDRILDADCRYVICADEGRRGGRTIPLKAQVDTALQACPDVKRIFVVRNTGCAVSWDERHVWFHLCSEAASPECPPEVMDAEAPLFILYTSGSTGKPKGVLHTTGGYLVYAAMTHHYVFDYQPGEIYWCTADVGWVTGHSYLLYGPLCNGATTLMFEGIPTYPAADRFWRIIDKHQVNIFYTAPTAIRALMAQGDQWLTTSRRTSLRILGSVGEPINPEAWEWYYHQVGQGHCPIVDTWWQTETGGILISPLPGATRLKPGSATLPFFGVVPTLIDGHGIELEGAGAGVLALARSWPGQARTLYGNHARFVETYFSLYPGRYFTGDGARRDEDGYYWISGRVDDVLNVSGHRMGTAEIESALVLHDLVAEAAVVGYPHDIKGQGIYAYVTLVADATPSAALKQELIRLVRQEIGAIATPDIIQWTPALPKTRSGKIMRRILRKIAANDTGQLGDISTLADPAVVEDIIQHHKDKT
ncbi:acetate--CoA ligase [Candidatus Woesearchaeota archaeon]|nr:acetate--CoA ligase [Candidatus Woesearchaeota archaeon]